MSVDYRSMYDKEFLGAWDVAEREVTVTITKVEAGMLTGLGGRKTKKPVIRMRNTEKGFALNSTNGKTIATLYGNLVEAWVGKKITLYKSTTRNPNGDGDVDCIRVRPAIPRGNGAAKPAELAPEPTPQPDNGFSDEGDADPGTEPEVTLDQAVARLSGFKDLEKMAEWADLLPGGVTGDERFAAAYKKRLDEIKLG